MKLFPGVIHPRRLDFGAKGRYVPAKPPRSMSTSDATHLALYRQMILIRRFEEEAARAYSQGKIGGFLHLYIGQEPIAVGAVAALEPHDYVITTYRDHGLALAKGMSARAAMAELYGKVTVWTQRLARSTLFPYAAHYRL